MWIMYVCVFRLFQAEHELRVAQTEFDRQAEVTRLLLEGISSTHVSLFAPLTILDIKGSGAQNNAGLVL